MIEWNDAVRRNLAHAIAAHLAAAGFIDEDETYDETKIQVLSILEDPGARTHDD